MNYTQVSHVLGVWIIVALLEENTILREASWTQPPVSSASGDGSSSPKPSFLHLNILKVTVSWKEQEKCQVWGRSLFRSPGGSTEEDLFSAV